MSTISVQKGKLERLPRMVSVEYEVTGDDLIPDSVMIFTPDTSRNDERIALLSALWQTYVRSAIAWMSENFCRGGSVGLFGDSTNTGELGARVITVCVDSKPDLLEQFPEVVERLLTEALGDAVIRT